MTDSSVKKEKVKMELERAKKIAERIQKRITPYCEQIVIAGSIRRGLEAVGDIEFVAIPNTVITDSPFFEGVKMPPIQPLYEYMDRWELQGKIEQIRKGKKLRSFWLLNKDGEKIIKIDLFLVTPPAQFGPIMLIRTGPSVFSKSIVKARKNNKFKFDKGRLVKLNDDEEIIKVYDTPTEHSVFEILDIPFVYPHKRVGKVNLVERKTMTDEEKRKDLGFGK